MKDTVWFDIDLHLFDGGAAAGDGAGDIAGETKAGPADAGQGKNSGEKQIPTPKGRRHGRGRETAVLYGKQPTGPAEAGTEGKTGDLKASTPDAGEKVGESTTPDTQEERLKRYKELINGEFKDLYTRDTQNMINQRFKAAKDLERKVGESQPILDMLMDRYGITDGDAKKLMKALDADKAYWTEAAEEAGMGVEEYKRYQKFQRRNKELYDAQQKERSQGLMNRQLLQWYMEGDALRKVYPHFDLQAESKQPRFLALLKSGVPVRHAYEVIHMDEIKAGVAQSAAKATEKQVVAGIRAKGVRPAENGTAAQSGFIVKDDVSKLTKKDRAEIARRVQMGDTSIRF